MKVEYSGWSEKYGTFCCYINVDETKTDYELHFENGIVARQKSSFSNETHDWNHDGDVYTQYGAWFGHFDKEGKNLGGEFLTPEDMVRGLIEGMDQSSACENKILSIPGIQIPPIQKKPSLDEQILRNERRRDAQSIERNRKMNALGIRQPGEPWAR